MYNKVCAFILFYMILFFASNAYANNDELIKLFQQTNKQVQLINKEINEIATIEVQNNPKSLSQFQSTEAAIRKIISTLESKKLNLGLRFDQYNKDTKNKKKRFLFFVIDNVTKSYYEAIRRINLSINLAKRKLVSTSNNKSKFINFINLTAREKKVLNYFSADSVNDVSSKEINSINIDGINRVKISSEEIYEVNKETYPIIIINN